jgi:hypothetical protein
MIYSYEMMSYDFVNQYFINYPITFKIWKTGHVNTYSCWEQMGEKDLRHAWYEDICKDNLILTNLNL